MDIKKKNEADNLVGFFIVHRLIDPTRSDAAMLATLCHMVAHGDKDVALYILETLGEPQACPDEGLLDALEELLDGV